MEIQLCCSEHIRIKINKHLMTHGIVVSEDGPITLVEKGCAVPSDTIGIVFDAIDYMEAIDMIVVLLFNRIGLPNENIILGYYEDRYTIIKHEKIQFIEAKKTEVTCVTGDQKFYLKKPLYHYEAILERVSFVRINKSQIVNLMKVEEVVPWFNSRLVLSLESGIQLEVSKKYAKALRKILDM